VDRRSTAPPGPEESVGVALARLRKQRKLTGAQLGRLVGMSQPKISRLENGVGFPDPADVGRVARALGADESDALRLVELAEQSHNRMTDWRPLPTELAQRQRGIGEWEAEARAFRVFQPAVVVGLLQTSEYARAILGSFQGLISPGFDDAGRSVSEAVSARMRRQEILSDPARSFRFVMTESVLGNRLCPPEDMPAQIHRLREVGRQENVSIGIVPAEAAWSTPPFHGFLLLDDDIVSVDLFNTGLTSRGKADIRVYQQVFDDFEAAAVTEIDPILDKYQEIYLDLARAGLRR